jgi:hypothetical protein
VEFYGNADEGAIGVEELVDLFSHDLNFTPGFCF